MPERRPEPARIRNFVQSWMDCSKEADETQLWIELLVDDCGVNDSEMPAIHREAGEIIAIFTTIVSKVRKTL